MGWLDGWLAESIDQSLLRTPYVAEGPKLAVVAEASHIDDLLERVDVGDAASLPWLQPMLRLVLLQHHHLHACMHAFIHSFVHSFTFHYQNKQIKERMQHPFI